MKPDVLIKRLDPGVPLPAYAHPGDAGADLSAAEDVKLGPRERYRPASAHVASSAGVKHEAVCAQSMRMSTMRSGIRVQE